MKQVTTSLTNRLIRYFLAGVFAILPIVITGAVVVWVANFLNGFVGPNTFLGGRLQALGLRFGSDGLLAYVFGWIFVLAFVFILGVVVELGARKLIQRIIDGLLKRIPLINSIYDTSKRLVDMMNQKDDEAIKGMQAVFCTFGGENGLSLLALLVSPATFHINGRDYRAVIVPTAPVPVGGGLFFVPAEQVRPADISIDALMSIYVSMGVTASEFLPPAAKKPNSAK